MRLVILIAATASLTAGVAFAQYDARQLPEAWTQPAAPPAGAPTNPNAGAAMTEMQAKSKIEAQGFTNVSELKKDSEGTWNAKAMIDGKFVLISLDNRGQIEVLN